MQPYPKRLIEVDLLIKRISAHARREKSIRHGHISTLHIWWARRPLAACRAVICAALWPDPADPLCPDAFLQTARRLMIAWAKHNLGKVSEDSYSRFVAIQKNPDLLDERLELRASLLNFIADFANWDNSNSRQYLETCRAITDAAHRSLDGAEGTHPLVVDPFAGGGSIPLEALRVGADTFASDLNPLPVLLNKVVLEYVPRFGQFLADEVRKWGDWIRQEAATELAEFYPKDPDGATPIAYLWARTIVCEGPGCGAEVPLLRSRWLAKSATRSVAFQLIPNLNTKTVDFKIMVKEKADWVQQDGSRTTISDPSFDGTVKRGSATCPCCGYTTPVTRVREQLRTRQGGAYDSRLFCVVTSRDDGPRRSYRTVIPSDLATEDRVRRRFGDLKNEKIDGLSAIPSETLPVMSGVFNAPIYGHNTWGTLFNPRQAVTLCTIARLIKRCGSLLAAEHNTELATAVQTCLSLALGRLADRCSNLCTWDPSPAASGILHIFSRQAIPFVWDYAEGAPLEQKSGGWLPCLEWIALVIERESSVSAQTQSAQVQQASATHHPLPDDSAHAVITDPPYYNAVPYADLSDFFYVWLKRSLSLSPQLFSSPLSPKDEECCEMSGWDPVRYSQKDGKWFENQMSQAMTEARRITQPGGIAVVVFAHKSTSGWEALLQALTNAGWTITGSWPIDTEMGNRLRAMNSAVLASSVHLVCRPRENTDGTLRIADVGDWRDILQELPRRIHDWMPRLAEEHVVGADAIFACLGPALEIFSRYARVEKADGEVVALREYLEQVWAAVAKEALTMIFAGADTAGFEEDARLTAMWLWTLNSGNNGAKGEAATDTSGDAEDDSDIGSKKPKVAGFILEYDAARKIAQGLGAHLEDLGSVVEVSGDTARLLPVVERAQYLFGRDESRVVPSRKAKQTQPDLFKATEMEFELNTTSGEYQFDYNGKTVLDQIHQSMILFSAGRGEALKRFLVEDGVGRAARFWNLAQALSALYPANTPEKRWVDGVLARKKSLGF